MERGETPGDIHAPCRARIERLEQQVRELQARLNQNSRNSSKPPSSDPPWVPPKPPKPPTGRRPGGQPGHEGHGRDLVPPDEVDQIVVLKPEQCGRCGRPLSGGDPDPWLHQVTETPPVKPHTTEYQQHTLACSGCGCETRASLPPGVPQGAFGPRLLAILAYLSGKGRLSKRQIQDAVEDLFGVTISVGAISEAEGKLSHALAAPVEEARAFVQEQPFAHVDETGWKEGSKKAWLWVAATPLVTVFMIHLRRGAQAAKALLGTFEGILITDRWSAYHPFWILQRQLCWAHLIRDFQGFLEGGKKAVRIGKRLLKEAERMFSLWHRVRDGTLSHRGFRRTMKPVQHRVERLLVRGAEGADPKTASVCTGIMDLVPALWTFVRHEGIEPTNNAAERALRPAVLYRKGCFGTKSPEGSRFVERMLTVVATLRQQGRNVLDYLTQATQAAISRKAAPSILPPPAAEAAA